MTLNEAKSEIQSRITERLRANYENNIPEYFEALEIAVQCMDAQVRIASILQALEESTNDDGMIKVAMVKEMLTQCFYQLSMEEVMERLDKLTIKGELNEINNSDN